MIIRKKTSSPLIIFIAAAVFIVIGICMSVNHSHLTKVCTEKTTATVVSCDKYITKSSKGKRKTQYDTDVSFEADGKMYTYRLPSKSHSHTVGSSYEIKYNPSDPNECLDPSTGNQGVYPVGAGIFAFILGLIAVFSNRKNERDMTADIY